MSALYLNYQLSELNYKSNLVFVNVMIIFWLNNSTTYLFISAADVTGTMFVEDAWPTPVDAARG